MRSAFTMIALLPLPLAAVELPALFSDHAVLQAGNDIPVWGSGRDGEKIRVSIAGAAASTTVAGGTWKVHLSGLKSAAVGQDLVVAGDTTLTVRDVLIGDVWLCGGQSNMEWSIRRSHNAPEVTAQARDSGIRFFVVPHNGSITPLRDVKAQWTVCSQESVPKFSAVGYHFGRELRRLRQIPVGLIGSYWGGTFAQAWMSLEGLGATPSFTNYLEDQAKHVADLPRLRTEWPQVKAAYEAEMNRVNEVNAAAFAAYERAVAAARAASQPEPTRPKVQMPPKWVSEPDCTPHVPANLYHGMIAPLVGYGITGVIWYQGENNSGKADEYATLFPRLIMDWRAKWGRGDFPFLFVQLSTWQEPQRAPVEHGGIPQVRQTQLAALALPNTGMTTALDVNDGSDIHPANKQVVGERLAQVARKVAYGENVACESPSFKAVKMQGASLRIILDHAEGLHVAVPPWLGPKAIAPSATEPVSFAVCGADGVWGWAKALLDGTDVILTSDTVPLPVAAAHAWAPNTAINVYNGAGLPLLPFVTDAAMLPLPVAR